MELIYIYVGEYEILKNKEITLTSRFNVVKKRSKIEIKAGVLPHDFFSKRKTDVIGFFGINGSGKSTAQELIRNIITNNEGELPSDYIIILRSGENFLFSQGQGREYKVFHDKEEVKRIALEDIAENKLPLIYYTSIKPANELNEHQYKSIKTEHCISAGTLFDSLDPEWLGEQHSQTAKAFEFIDEIGFDEIEKKYAPMLCTVDLDYYFTKLIKKIQNSFIASLTKEKYEEIVPDFSLSKLKKITCLSNYPDIELLLEEIKEKNSNSRFIHKSEASPTQVIKCKFRLVFKKSFIRSLKDLSTTMPNLDKFYFEIICKILDEKFQAGSFDDILDSIFLLQSITNGFVNNISNEAAQLLYTIDNLEHKLHLSNFFYNVDQIKSQKNKIIIEIRTFKNFIELNTSLQSIRNWLPKINFSWNKISSGQYSQLHMFSQIYRAWKTLEKNKSIENSRNIILMIDEGEICLHPELQRSWLVDTLKRLEKIVPKTYKIQLFISSHSPLVLSELPAGTVNFMYKKPPTKPQPDGYFGADIYTLYGSGFLLKNTLSELAFQKIANTFKELNDDATPLQSYEAYHTFANLVSDEIVKKLLLNTIESRFEKK